MSESPEAGHEGEQDKPAGSLSKSGISQGPCLLAGRDTQVSNGGLNRFSPEIQCERPDRSHRTHEVAVPSARQWRPSQSVPIDMDQAGDAELIQRLAHNHLRSADPMCQATATDRIVLQVIEKLKSECRFSHRGVPPRAPIQRAPAGVYDTDVRWPVRVPQSMDSAGGSGILGGLVSQGSGGKRDWIDRPDQCHPQARQLLPPLAVLSVLAVTTEAAFRLLIQLYLKDLAASPLVISLSTSLAWLGILIGSAVWGTLSDTRGRRGLLAAILVGGALAAGLSALLPQSIGTLGLSFARVAMLTGIAPVTMAMMSAASTLDVRARNLSYLSSAREVGFMLGSATAGFVLALLDYRWSFVFFAILPLTALPMVFRLTETEDRAGRTKSRSLSLLRGGGLRSLYLGTVLRQMGNTGAGSLIFVYMATLGISTGSMGLLNALNPTMQIVAMLIFGRLADRIGRRRVFLLGFLLSTVVMVLYAVSRNAAGLAAAFSTLGIAFPALYVGSTAYIGDRVPLEKQGAMLGLFESSRGLGGVLGPLIAGMLVPYTGYRGMFLAMAGLAALGLLLVAAGRHESPGT